MESIQRNPDERDVRYLKLVFGRAQGAEDEQIVKDLDDPNIDSPHVLYRRLKVDGFPICPMCGTTHVEEGHCKPSRKARRGAGERQDLPSAAEAIPLFSSVVKALDGYVVDLTTLKEVYRDERFEAVDHYEVTALVDLENNITNYGQGTLPRGATQNPPHQLIALIAAYVIEGKPLDPLLEKLHPSQIDANQQRDLERKVDNLRLAAHHVAKLVRGGTIRTGRHTDELTPREQAAAEYITSKTKAGMSKAEMDQTLLDRGFSKNEIYRLRRMQIDYPDQ